jgi:beta-1,4-N-acetylglucosaminyltransferase
MLTLLRDLDTRAYTHRSYIVGAGDSLSLAKAKKFELGLRERVAAGVVLERRERESGKRRGGNRNNVDKAGLLEEEEVEARYGSYSVALVPRARRIHQSLYTTPVSCLYTLLATLKVLSSPPVVVSVGGKSSGKAQQVSHVPDIILANGPATSAIVILASILLRFFDFSGQQHGKTRIVYIESFARISDVSLSGKCVAWLVDRFFVQWEELKGAVGGRAEYRGLLSINPDERGGFKIGWEDKK